MQMLTRRNPGLSKHRGIWVLSLILIGKGAGEAAVEELEVKQKHCQVVENGFTRESLAKLRYCIPHPPIIKAILQSHTPPYFNSVHIQVLVWQKPLLKYSDLNIAHLRFE